MNSKVSIVMLNLNGLKDTIECLESLKKISYPNYEIVLVDNGSKCNDAEILEERYRGYVKLIRSKDNLGFAEGNNVGFRQVLAEGQSEYILVLNNDTYVEPDFLDELMKCTERHPEAGSVQTKMIWALHPHLIDAAGIEYSRHGFGFNRGGYEPIERYDEEKEIFGCCAGACIYKSKALKETIIGNDYFDKDFFCNYEDFDLAFRLQWAGWKAWYAPKSIVYHKRGGTTGTISDFIVYYNRRNLVWSYFKDLSKGLIIKNLPYFVIGQIAQLGRNLAKGQFIVIKAKFDAYRNLGMILRKRKQIKRRVNPREIDKWLIKRWKANTPVLGEG